RLLMPDTVGSLAKVAELLAEHLLDVRSIIQINTENKKSAVEFQLIGKLSAAEIEAIFKTAGFEVDDIHVTENKLVR
ncbi:MAG: acetoin utilization protein, partial [Lactococcus sp.]|nr:acetoin utilization protein [Lactococcus sp.]